MKTLLHVGCGTSHLETTPFARDAERWRELRMDVCSDARPDIVGSMTDMASVPGATFDAVYSSHSIEHLYPHEVAAALAEFKRILKPEGFALITCPDLQSICALVAEGHLTEPAYMSPAGPIAPLDILYGYRPSLEAGQYFMAHRCGFTQTTLRQELMSSGFASIASARRATPDFDLWALAFVTPQSDKVLRAVSSRLFPVRDE